MHQTSSALYRYFANRDELITELIIDAYNEMGETVEQTEAQQPRTSYRGRWLATAKGVRAWALANRNEFALLYGTPIPDYERPGEISTASVRVPLVLSGILADHFARFPVKLDPTEDFAVGAYLDLELMRSFMPGVPANIIIRGVTAWVHLFGHLGFELAGQFDPLIIVHGRHYDAVVDIIGDLVGID